MSQFKAAWLQLRRVPWWVSLLLSLSLIVWSHFDYVRQEQNRQRQRIELASIDVQSDKLERDIERYNRDYTALLAKKRWNKADRVRAKMADKELESLDARLKAIERRTREVCGP